ncbi:unnamed protein product [Caenorhabditis auriculariae]|uniref:Uncharacterized protein n=1 Tax=Caenorhabditis auriculariae TaxID=2777116 RepID=A0A8S1HFG1_9PELO|nr:unnamed protein product [Caenorhabditis auriculariae]
MVVRKSHCGLRPFPDVGTADRFCTLAASHDVVQMTPTTSEGLRPLRFLYAFCNRKVVTKTPKTKIKR